MTETKRKKEQIYTQQIKTQLYLLTIIISYINVGEGECAI